MPSSSLVAGRLGDDDSWSRQQGAAVSDDVLSEPCHCSSFVSSTAAMLLELFVIDRHDGCWVGATMVVVPGATWCSMKHHGGASACSGFLSAGCFAEVVGASSSLGHKRAAGMVDSGVSLHRRWTCSFLDHKRAAGMVDSSVSLHRRWT
jgi:hypothetical protein